MRVILFTCTQDEAPILVRTLLEEGLIACGNIVSSVRAIYRWQGQIEDAVEALVLAETSSQRVEVAVQRLRELHSYDTPKILVIDPAHCDARYLAWLSAVTDSGD